MTVYICTDRGQHVVAYLGEWTAELAEEVAASIATGAGSYGVSIGPTGRFLAKPKPDRPLSGTSIYHRDDHSLRPVGGGVQSGGLKIRPGGATVTWHCSRCGRAPEWSLRRLIKALAAGLAEVDISYRP